jgi:site-specific DNA recombinase
MIDSETSLKIAAYARVSTEEQRDGQTIDSQIAELETLAYSKNWVVSGVYSDEGWSGSVIVRPALDRLRDDARLGRFQAVLINDVDRLARDVVHLGVIKRDLEKQNVQVIFRKVQSEAGPVSNLLVNILGSFAEFERELICDRTRRGRRYRVERRKQYLGSNTAYGYRYDRIDRVNGKPGRLALEALEARIVRRIFHWVDAEGLSAGGVARRLETRSAAQEKLLLEQDECPANPPQSDVHRPLALQQVPML